MSGEVEWVITPHSNRKERNRLLMKTLIEFSTFNRELGTHKASLQLCPCRRQPFLHSD